MRGGGEGLRFAASRGLFRHRSRGRGGVFICGIRTLLHYFFFSLFAPGFEQFQEFVADAAEVGLVAAEGLKDAGFVAEGAVGDGDAGCGVAGFDILVALHFEIEEGGFEGDGAVEAPAGGGELVDEVDVEAGFGPELEDVGFAEGAELAHGLVAEDGAAGGEAVGEGGGLAAGEAFGGDGSAGAGSVGARGGDAARRRHSWNQGKAERGGGAGGQKGETIEKVGDGVWGMRGMAGGGQAFWAADEPRFTPIRKGPEMVAARYAEWGGRMEERERLWVPAGHFYSPLVDPADAHVRKAVDGEAHPAATAASLGLDEREMLRWFSIVSAHYGSKPFPEHPAEGSRYHCANPQFPLADALALLGIMVQAKPRRYVEVGCGYSSCAAIDINEKYLGGGAEMTFIEPYPETFVKLVGGESKYADRLQRTKLQDAPLELFTRLNAGDVVFIDCSHVAKTGSDVLDYMFRILPALPKGVLIHIHDIFFPFEYPAAWILGENRSWNEAYLLRAFLLYNAGFRVIYFSDWMYKCRREIFGAAMPLCVQHRGGSIWMEKRE
jgi:Methyltransferase domain